MSYTDTTDHTGLKRGVLSRCWETGTILVDAREFAMAEDASIRVVGCEGFQELVEGVLLGLGAGVCGMAMLIETSLVDDAKGAPVVAFYMDALDGLRQERDDTAIVADVVVVGHLAPLLLAAVDQGFDTEGAVAAV